MQSGTLLCNASVAQLLSALLPAQVPGRHEGKGSWLLPVGHEVYLKGAVLVCLLQCPWAHRASGSLWQAHKGRQGDDQQGTGIREEQMTGKRQWASESDQGGCFEVEVKEIVEQHCKGSQLGSSGCACCCCLELGDLTVRMSG